MNFIIGTNREQTYFTTPDDLIARDNSVTSAHTNKAAHFCDIRYISTAADKLCALNAKETNGAFKELFDRLVAKKNWQS